MTKNKGWHPPIYKTPLELEVKVDKYFESWHNKKEVITSAWVKIQVPYKTITDLAIYLWFESRQSFYDYEKRGKFSYIIKRARLFIEREYEEKLHLQSPTGAIFALKNMWWKDRTEVETTWDSDKAKAEVYKKLEEKVNDMKPDEVNTALQDLLNR